MLRQINPYNALAIYDRDTPQARIGYLYSPLSVFVPFSFHVADPGESMDTWELVNTLNTASAVQSSALITTYATASQTWFIYNGGALDNPPIAGTYQAVITTKSGVKYYSHMVAMSRAFDTFGATNIVKGSCLAAPDGSTFTINFTATFAAWGEGRVLLSPSGNGNFTFLSANTAFTLSNNDIGTVGASAVLRVETTFALPNEPGALHSIYRDYSFVYEAGDPCDGVLNALGPALSTYSETCMLMQWTNANDFPDMNLLYQEGYIQKLYLFLYRLEYTPIVEEAYDRNSSGGEFIRQAVYMEEQAHDYFPFPDYLNEVFRTIRQHSTKGIKFLNSAVRPVYNVQAERKEIAQSYVPMATIRVTLLPVSVQGCEDNFELVED